MKAQGNFAFYNANTETFLNAQHYYHEFVIANHLDYSELEEPEASKE